MQVVNAGSSSLKFKLFGIEPFAAGWGGVVERIGDVEKSRLIAKGSDANGQVGAKPMGARPLPACCLLP